MGSSQFKPGRRARLQHLAAQGSTEALEALNNDPSSQVIFTKRGVFKKGGKLDPDKMNRAAKVAASQDTDIFKFQRPIVTNGDTPMILAYNQSRSWEGQFPMTQAWKEVFGEKFKVYLICTADPDGKLHPIVAISDQAW